MSFEGYYQVRCKNGHYYRVDCYSFDSDHRCMVCDATVKYNLVDETNGESDGYDYSMEDGADQQITVWQSDLDQMKKIVSSFINHSNGLSKWVRIAHYKEKIPKELADDIDDLYSFQCMVEDKLADKEI